MSTPGTMPDATLVSPTPVDLDLALAFFAVLVEVARSQQTVTYGELVARAKATFPTNESVQNAIPVSVGRRLDFVREFTRQRGIPDLTSLVISKSTGECGVGFTRNHDPQLARASVFAHDWQSESADFTGAIASVRKRSKPRKRITEDAAAKLMFEHYAANRDTLPPTVRQLRQQIIDRLMAGEEVADAFSQALAGDHR